VVVAERLPVANIPEIPSFHTGHCQPTSPYTGSKEITNSPWPISYRRYPGAHTNGHSMPREEKGKKSNSVTHREGKMLVGRDSPFTGADQRMEG